MQYVFDERACHSISYNVRKGFAFSRTDWGYNKGYGVIFSTVFSAVLFMTVVGGDEKYGVWMCLYIRPYAFQIMIVDEFQFFVYRSSDPR